MIKIPTSELTDDALLGVIDAFILREGTDYGHQDFTLDEKRDRVKAMLQSGAAEICLNLLYQKDYLYNLFITYQFINNTGELV